MGKVMGWRDSESLGRSAKEKASGVGFYNLSQDCH